MQRPLAIFTVLHDLPRCLTLLAAGYCGHSSSTRMNASTCGLQPHQRTSASSSGSCHSWCTQTSASTHRRQRHSTVSVELMAAAVAEFTAAAVAGLPF
jgi:hypothetical protein